MRDPKKMMGLKVPGDESVSVPSRHWFAMKLALWRSKAALDIAQRAAKRYDVLILDELFKHVDRDGGEAIAEMLTKLRHEKSSVFVIEHDAEFQSRFENRVLIRRKGARSAIVELDNELSGDRQTPPPVPRKTKPKRTPVHHHVQTRSAS